MSALPYDEILKAVAECVTDLDRNEEIANSMLNRLFAPMDRLQDIQSTREKNAERYAGQHRRASEQVKGKVDTTMPRVHHESHDRTEDQFADTSGV